jgi:hypothetical protein
MKCYCDICTGPMEKERPEKSKDFCSETCKTISKSKGVKLEDLQRKPSMHVNKTHLDDFQWPNPIIPKQSYHRHSELRYSKHGQHATTR